ncbi:MAG: tRNA (cytidine(34)-2'-O)-methyltransferase [Deltaproteobacteria bacterium]|nr:tRNA (cytidine(34)-2'-O)-methyltransferase [Deltaproteobacteria bacterium]
MPQGPKLRAAALTQPFHVVLVEPEIPPNTGAVARTCAATASRLHLVGELGFSIDERAVRRAGLDYWHLVDLHTHPDLDAFVEAQPGARLHLFSSSAPHSHLEADFRPGDALVFGRESVGLDAATLARPGVRRWAIPTLGGVRSLNLATSVSIVVYEALRQVGALDHTYVESAQDAPR